MGKRLTIYILGALVLGLVVGLAAHASLDAAQVERLTYYLSIVTDLFLRLIKMIIAPLVLATLIVGIAGMGGDTKALGRIGTRAVAWFIQTRSGPVNVPLTVRYYAPDELDVLDR